MSRDELKAAFREGYSHNFDNIPIAESDVNFDISEHFENKMKTLIQKENKTTWHWFNPSYKKVVTLIAALMIMLTMTFSVSAIRIPVVEFFTNVYETFMEFLFEGDTSDDISIRYTFKEVPNGFKVVDKYEDKTTFQTTYKNKSGDVIELSQTITDNTNHSLDLEQGNVKIITINGNSINLYLNDQVSQAIWIEKDSLMTLTYEGSIDENEMIKLLNLIEATK